MAKPLHNRHVDQTFKDTERLFRRVFRTNLKHDGKATFLAFELPDMSVNRERHSTAVEARKGFLPEDWGVVSFFVKDIPPRETLPFEPHTYRFHPRHVPVSENGNFAHTEVRVWRTDKPQEILITNRDDDKFDPGDPDKDCLRAGLAELNPDFHMRWRKRMEWACNPELQPETA